MQELFLGCSLLFLFDDWQQDEPQFEIETTLETQLQTNGINNRLDINRKLSLVLKTWHIVASCMIVSDVMLISSTYLQQIQ